MLLGLKRIVDRQIELIIKQTKKTNSYHRARRILILIAVSATKLY